MNRSDLEIALSFVPPPQRSAASALWALDNALGRVVATTTEPMIGQMRLTWWHDRLRAIDDGEVAAEPILTAVAALDITGARLAELVEGWEALLDPLPLDAAAIATHMDKRGGQLFAIIAEVLGSPAEVRDAGAGWAAMDFAQHCSDPVTAERAWALARARLSGLADPEAKSLRTLTRLARGDSLRPIGAPRSRWAMLRATLF